MGEPALLMAEDVVHIDRKVRRTNSNGTLSWSSKAWVLANASISTSSGNPDGALQINGGSASNVATRPVDLSVFASRGK